MLPYNRRRAPDAKTDMTPNSASPKVSHKRVFTLTCWQPRSANTGFCSASDISSCGFRASRARTPFCAILWRSPRYSMSIPKHAKTCDASLRCDVLLKPTMWIARFQGFRWNRKAICAVRCASQKIPGRNYIRPPPLPPFLAIRYFSGEGGGGVSFEAPRGRNFIRPPPLLHPPPLGGSFQGWGGGGLYKIRPRKN